MFEHNIRHSGCIHTMKFLVFNFFNNDIHIIHFVALQF